jgi:hypothetical protein
MLVLEPTEIAMLPPELDTDKPLSISMAPLSPTLAVAVFNDRLPNTPAVPELLNNTGTLTELVAMPAPDEMVMELPKAVLVTSSPSIITAPLLVLPSPKARVKIPPLLVDDDPETINTSLPAAPEEFPAITLNTPLMLVPEPTEIAMLSPEPDADKPLSISRAPLLPTLSVTVFNNRSPADVAEWSTNALSS